MPTLFVAYSHKDESLRGELEDHLSGLGRQELIDVWHDRRIDPGEDWSDKIGKHLEEADVILLLISPAFIASDYCYGVELKRALERHGQGSATVIPVILRPCDWKDLPLGKLQATPTDGRPITMYPNQDQAFLEVTQAVKRALKLTRVGRIQASNEMPWRRARSEAQTRFKTGQTGASAATFRFDGYVDGTELPAPRPEEMAIPMGKGEVFPPIRSTQKACWWKRI